MGKIKDRKGTRTLATPMTKRHSSHPEETKADYGWNFSTGYRHLQKPNQGLQNWKYLSFKTNKRMVTKRGTGKSILSAIPYWEGKKNKVRACGKGASS